MVNEVCSAALLRIIQTILGRTGTAWQVLVSCSKILFELGTYKENVENNAKGVYSHGRCSGKDIRNPARL